VGGKENGNMCWTYDPLTEEQQEGDWEPTEEEMEAAARQELADRRAARHRRGVRFDPAKNVIDVAGNELDLDSVTDARGLLIWLLEIGLRSKPQHLHDLLQELDDASRQVFGEYVLEVYCPFGKEPPAVVNWHRAVNQSTPTEGDAVPTVAEEAVAG
jgi:hypothetical protein